MWLGLQVAHQSLGMVVQNTSLGGARKRVVAKENRCKLNGGSWWRNVHPLPSELTSTSGEAMEIHPRWEKAKQKVWGMYAL